MEKVLMHFMTYALHVKLIFGHVKTSTPSEKLFSTAPS